MFLNGRRAENIAASAFVVVTLKPAISSQTGENTLLQESLRAPLHREYLTVHSSPGEIARFGSARLP